MANYFDQTCFLVECNKSQRLKLLNLLQQKEEELEASGESPIDIRWSELSEGIQFASYEECPDWGALLDVLTKWQNLTKSNKPIFITGAFTCNKDVIDAFSGYGYLVYKGKYKQVDVLECLNTMWKKMKK